jgi:CHAT domain-containing protein
VVSATVYAELKRQRRTSDDRAVQLVAFGDPLIQDYDADRPERISDAEVRSAVRGGLELVSLPASRLEVEQIARFYPKRSRVHLGAEVTEEAAKAVGRETRYLHFATHGFVNEHFPLNSALVLSMPRDAQGGRNNGLLQAWEILEQVRLDADLVTLSACETGLGKEMGGEGLVGLTRAFQYAGARSVLASLWSVSDESTADLMTSFYRYLRAGLTKDVALRTAQIEMIRVKGPNSHPFHWAGFELIGDWR